MRWTGYVAMFVSFGGPGFLLGALFNYLMPDGDWRWTRDPDVLRRRRERRGVDEFEIQVSAEHR